jgi:hypothetical protein
MIEHSDIVVAVTMRTDWPARHPSPKKLPAPRIATTASLPLGNDREPDLALLNIEDGLGWVTFGEHHLVLSVICLVSSLSNFRQKRLRIELRRELRRA